MWAIPQSRALLRKHLLGLNIFLKVCQLPSRLALLFSIVQDQKPLTFYTFAKTTFKGETVSGRDSKIWIPLCCHSQSPNVQTLTCNQFIMTFHSTGHQSAHANHPCAGFNLEEIKSNMSKTLASLHIEEFKLNPSSCFLSTGSWLCSTEPVTKTRFQMSFRDRPAENLLPLLHEVLDM